MRQERTTLSRRRFLATAAAATAYPLRSNAAIHEQNVLRVALVGCGSRGTGAAANALSTAGPVKLVAMADVFRDRLSASLQILKRRFESSVDVPPERQFLGFDAYRHAIDCVAPGGLVLLATPPVFRPLHLEYAVQQAVHVFMEKAFAVDPPGVRRVLAAGRIAAEKNLKIMGGLVWRQSVPRQEVIKRIHDGAIGQVTCLRSYRMQGPVRSPKRRPGESELAHQIRNFYSFSWLNGGYFVDWAIHHVDVACWAKGAWPVEAHGMGGRIVRDEPDQMWDHYSVEYTFADGTKLFVFARHMPGCWNQAGDYAHGTRGAARIMLNFARPASALFKDHRMRREDLVWTYEGPRPNPYQRELDVLVEAIRSDKPHNEAERCAYACLTVLMGRTAAWTGKLVRRDELLASDQRLAPDVDRMAWETPPPVQPDADGRYPIARPGI